MTANGLDRVDSGIQLPTDFATSNELRTYLPPVQCKPWCVDQDGHGNCGHREDQYCVASSLRVGLSLHDQIAESVYVPETKSYAPGPDAVQVDLTQSPDGAPEITLDVIGDDAVLRFAPCEARELIECLQLLLGQIEGAR